MSNPTAHLTAHLASKGLSPTPTWLSTFLTTQRPTTPLPALLSTALFRLLASDITTCLLPTPPTCFPADIHDASLPERRLGGGGAIAAQVLSVEDMSKSRWEQIEAIEAVERGEGRKGREIVRVDSAAEGGGQGVQAGGGGGGPHKLLLQDARGGMVWGIELRAVEGVGVGMCIGAKVVVRGARVARGVVLLEGATAVVLGGKIEALHLKWRERRKGELRAGIERGEG